MRPWTRRLMTLLLVLCVGILPSSLSSCVANVLDEASGLLGDWSDQFDDDDDNSSWDNFVDDFEDWVDDVF